VRAKGLAWVGCGHRERGATRRPAVGGHLTLRVIAVGQGKWLSSEAR